LLHPEERAAHRCSLEERVAAVAELAWRRVSVTPPEERAAAAMGERAVVARELSRCSAASRRLGRPSPGKVKLKDDGLCHSRSRRPRMGGSAGGIKNLVVGPVM